MERLNRGGYVDATSKDFAFDACPAMRQVRDSESRLVPSFIAVLRAIQHSYCTVPICHELVTIARLANPDVASGNIAIDTHFGGLVE